MPSNVVVASGAGQVALHGAAAVRRDRAVEDEAAATCWVERYVDLVAASATNGANVYAGQSEGNRSQRRRDASVRYRTHPRETRQANSVASKAAAGAAGGYREAGGGKVVRQRTGSAQGARQGAEA